MKRFRYAAFLMAAALLPAGRLPVSAQELTYGELTYTTNGTCVTITDCAADAVSVDIPAEIDGLPVTAIGYGAFDFCTVLTTVSMPDSVTSIGDYAFYYCTALTGIRIPEHLTDVGSYAFSECGSLTEISFPKSTERLSQGLFSGCDSLAAIHVEEGNVWSKSVDGVLYGLIDSVSGCDVPLIWLNCYPPAKSDTVFAVPEDVEKIAGYAFDSCRYLTSVTVPAGVQTIAEDAFFGCDALTAFDISENCTAAADIGGVLFNADGTRLLSYPAGNTAAQYIIPENTAEIAPRAFSDARYLESVQLPEGISHLEQHLFSGCTSLKTLVLPQSIAYIGFYALYECNQLTTIRYAGTQEEWNKVMLNTRLYGYEEGNEILGSVSVICADAAAAPLGDLNADNAVDAADAAMLLTAAAASGSGADSGLTDAQISAADLNADGAFDAVDAALILQYAAYTGSGGTMTLPEYLETV